MRVWSQIFLLVVVLLAVYLGLALYVEFLL